VTVAAANALLHRRPELYPEPEVFRPERFLGKRPDPYEWIPFGGGVRRCPGTAFAPYQMKMVVATVLSRCRLRLPAPNLPGAFHGLLLAPKGGLEVALVERLGAAA